MEQINNEQVPLPPKTSPLKKHKFLFITLAFLILLALIIPSGLFIFSKNQNYIDKETISQNLNEFPQYNHGFENNIVFTSSTEKGLSKIDFDNVAQIGCGNYMSDFTKDPALHIVYGLRGRGNFWILSFVRRDIKINSPYKLPIGFVSDKPEKLQLFACIDKEHDYCAINSNSSDPYDLKGTITLKKFEGCKIGDKVEFEIDAIREEFQHPNIYDQVKGSFSGQINASRIDNPFVPLVSVEELNTHFDNMQNDSESLD